MKGHTMNASTCHSEEWGRAFRSETMAVVVEPFWACLAEAIATVECGAGRHVIQGPCDAEGTPGLNEIGYKAIAGKPALEVVTREAEGDGLTRQTARFRPTPAVTCNARMEGRDVRRHCVPDAAVLEYLRHAMQELGLSARAYDRVLKVARTIADLAGSEGLAQDHVMEAVQLRSLDRQIWG